MPKVIQAAEFFVVGGPVQPERLCYVERAADRRLVEVIRAQRLACVLGPRASGKSSLMHRVARLLRQSRELTVLLDLAQLEARGESAVADRWVFGIAHRIAHELGLRIDLDAWWKEKTAVVGEQRLVDFFWEIVLTNTTVPVTIFIDEIDAALALPFAHELFAAIHACYSRRTRERDFARLNFVLLGCASRRQLAGDDRGSPFVTAELVELPDFTADEAYRLAVGFGGERDLAQALMDRVCAWTGGHPYLTQKVARGVARKGGKLEDVERVVREQLLAPGAAADEPLLNHVHSWLTTRSPPARRAAKLLHKLAAGARVRAPSDPAVLERLQFSGVVTLDAERRLQFRNRIVKELFAGPWRKRVGFGWRAAAAAAVLAAAVGVGAYWYTQYLPMADVTALTGAGTDAAALEESYRRLRALPGFVERADQLWVSALGRLGAAATTVTEAAAVDARLRAVPGQDAAADGLFAAFWLRRAAAATHAEQRDAALLLTQRAAALPAAPVEAAARLAELVGDDYPHLERSLRLSAAPAVWHMAFADSNVLSIDALRQLVRTPFGVASGSGALGTAPLRLTALRHSALSRELVIDGDGTAGELELTLSLQHPAPSELLVTLTAPGGAEATIVLPSSTGVAETFVFQAAQGSTLAVLADEGRRGTWRLTVVDRREASVGVLVGWGLRFGPDEWRDAPAELAAIPDAARTEAVTLAVAGTLALAWPEPPGAIGSVALWNLVAGRLENDFTLPSVPRHVAVNATGDRLLAATDRLLTLWNVADGTPVARLSTETEFVLPPVFSADGGYIAIAERVADAVPLYSVLRAADASLLGSSEGVEHAAGWQLGPGGRYAALLGPASVVRVLEPRRGGLLRQLPHVRDVARLVPLPDGARLLTVDAAGELAVWPLATAEPPRQLGTTTAAASVSLAADGTRVAFAAAGGTVAVVDVATGIEVARVDHGHAVPAATTQLSADGLRLVIASAAELRLWNLPAGPTASAPVTTTTAPTAIALDPAADVVAVGLASGQLRAGSSAAVSAAVATDGLGFFGHRGAVTAVAVNAAHGLVATGGRDGVVRFWDLATVEPTGAVMQPATEPVTVVTLSADGARVAAAAGHTVRVANVADGVVVAEIAVAGAVAALAFDTAASAIAIGDAAGSVTLAPLTAAGRSFKVGLDAAVTALAFAADDTLAVGTAAGGVHLLRAADGTALGGARSLPQAVRWLDFNGDHSALLVATDAWLHSFAAGAASLEPLHSRFLPRRGVATTRTAATGVELRLAVVDAGPRLGISALDLAATPLSVAAATPPLHERDWQAALALRLDDDGEPLPLAP